VESRRQDDQGHRKVTGQQNPDGKDRQEDHASQGKTQLINVSRQKGFFSFCRNNKTKKTQTNRQTNKQTNK